MKKFTHKEIRADAKSIQDAIDHFEGKYPKDMIMFILDKDPAGNSRVTPVADDSVVDNGAD